MNARSFEPEMPPQTAARDTERSEEAERAFRMRVSAGSDDK